MPHRPKVKDDTLLDALLGVFCMHGYEGASLSLISEATGLQRASLYHRFPGGKAEMAVAVLARVHAQFSEHVLAPLFEAGDPILRVARTAERLSAFYGRGARSCLLETLSLGEPDPVVRDAVERCFEAVLGAFSAVAREAGATRTAARRRAEEAVARYQGALVLARGSGDLKPFQRALAALPELITGE